MKTETIEKKDLAPRVFALREMIHDLRHQLYSQPRETPTQEGLFSPAPKGDFHWEGEPEDVGNAWVGSNGWRESIQVIDMGREGDKTWFLVLEDSHKGDNDYQPVGGWDEREGDEVTQDVMEDLWHCIEGRSIDHFAGWAAYYLDCAITGEDPLGVTFREFSADDYISAAEAEVLWLKNMINPVKSVA